MALKLLQPATRGWTRCFGFTFGEQSCLPSLYIVHGHHSDALTENYKQAGCARASLLAC